MKSEFTYRYVLETERSRCSCQSSGRLFTAFANIISGGVLPCITATIILESSGNLSPRNPLHKFIDFVIQTVHNVCQLPFEQLPCTFLDELLQGFQSCGRKIVTVVTSEFERL